MDFFIGNLTSNEFMNAGRHTDAVEETLHGFYAFQSSSLRISKIIGHVHHING